MTDTTTPLQADRLFDSKYCWGCGTSIHRSAPTCPSCGAPQKDVQVKAPTSPKSRVVTIVLALFLGGLGAHKFYLGRPGVGLIYLLFCWTFIPALLGFIEAIIYIFMSNEDFALKVVDEGASSVGPSAAAKVWTPGDGKRPVSLMLGLGVLILPYIFAWFLLRPGYSMTARIIGFVWLTFLVGMNLSAFMLTPDAVIS